MFLRLHKAILQKRIRLYEKGFFESFRLGAFTVSVGNLTIGGTGKTPLVGVAAEILSEAGAKVCVVSRGYKRINPKKRFLVSDGATIFGDARQAGDEPFELAGKLLERAVIVVADADRVAAGKWARERFGATAFVLDDAFQHLRAQRDLDILTIDATNPFGNGKLVPFGILREPLPNLKRADAVVITRANLAETIAGLKTEIRRHNADCPIFTAENKVSRLVKLKEFPANGQSSPKKGNNEQTKSEKFLAFCGLGNPRNFFDQLRGENFHLTAAERFPDHYFYKQSDIEKLERKAVESGAAAFLTTAKDAVKLKKLKFNLPCLVVESEMIFAGDEDFRGWLTAKFNQSKHR